MTDKHRQRWPAMRNENDLRGAARGPEFKETNHLLAALPKREYSRLERHLERVELRFGNVLHEPDQRIEYVHFPRSGVISAVKQFANGDTIEVATIGKEGVAGHSVALDVPTSGNRVLVQVPGEAVRITSSALIDAFSDCP